MPGRTTGFLTQSFVKAARACAYGWARPVGGGPEGGMSGLNRFETPVPVIAPHYRGAF